MGQTKRWYVADFETNNSGEAISSETTHVWLWDICDPQRDYEHITGDRIDYFISELSLLSPCTIYFHNLKFDGAFIIDWLLKHGYRYTEERKLSKGQFSALISEAMVFYAIKVFAGSSTVEIRDSSKKIAGTVRDIAYAYDLPITKGEIDYKLHRPIGYKATTDEIDYIRRDTEVVARALKEQYNAGLTRMTASSDALQQYKMQCPKNFKELFPVLDLAIDNVLREAYYGGMVICNPKYAGVELSTPVFVYDDNSMHPSQMYYKVMPYGEPKEFRGRYRRDEKYPLYIQRINVCCKVKEGHIPVVMTRKGMFHGIQYLTDTRGELVSLTLTDVDLEILFEHYDIFEIAYNGGFAFMGSKGLFKSYISEVYAEKTRSKGAKKAINKLKLNGLYGKFATNPTHYRRIPYLDKNIVKYSMGEAEVGEPVYTPVAVWTTAYSRQTLVKAIYANKEHFVYCDTDSVHTLEPAKGITIHESNLGDWKLEKVYVKAKYLGQKAYYGQTENGNKDIKLAGCPKNILEDIEFFDFFIGAEYNGKLMPKRVDGGVILVERTFTVKDRSK